MTKPFWFTITLMPLLVIACPPTPQVPTEDCPAEVVCGTPSDCGALCDRVTELNCGAEWNVEEADGQCLDLCQTAIPSLCPLYAATKTSCTDIEVATGCGQ